MKQFPDTFCICGLGPFTVDRHGIYDEDRTMYDCPRCEQEIPRSDPGRDATVEYYRGLLREAERDAPAAFDSRSTPTPYTVEYREQGRRLSVEEISDPFVNGTLYPRGWRVALAVLRLRYSVSFHVSATPEIVEAVLELDENYVTEHEPRGAGA
jgi:hypothetical protein